jgi:uncharacterized phosphosugar-binding protein
MAQLEGAKRYFDTVRAVLDQIAATQLPAIDAAATAVQQTVTSGGMVYIFGSGHSHMLAEEGHYRAGGLAAICPILSTSLMLHEGAVTSTQFERTLGIGKILLQRYAPEAKDTIFVISNSGVNPVPVELALAAKELGMTVVAIVALAYARQVPAKVDNTKLADIADIVIDNQGVPGDALVELGETGARSGPASTLAGAFILNAIFTEAAQRLTAEGDLPPVYISANMPGAAEHNQQLIARYRGRNPHL